MRTFINISSFHNLLDVIYTEISGTMKQFTVWIGMQCDRLLFDKIDNCTLNPSLSDSGLVVNTSQSTGQSDKTTGPLGLESWSTGTGASLSFTSFFKLLSTV